MHAGRAPLVAGPADRETGDAARPARLIGEIAVELGFATKREVAEAVFIARQRGVPTGQMLVERKVLRADQLARVLAARFGVDYVDLSTLEPDIGAVSLLSHDSMKRYQAVPVGFDEDGALLLAMADPTNVITADDVAMITARRVKVLAASAEDVAQTIARIARLDDSIEGIVDEEPDGGEAEQVLAADVDRDAPIIKLVQSLIGQAVARGASDIHITPQDGDTEVAVRVDGVLYHAASVRRRMTPSVVSRIKIMADLDISERRVPQDGRFALVVDGQRVDVRVVTLPLVYGEGVVMRILDTGAVVRELQALGMQTFELTRFEAAIARPHGAVLVTGPTGSGKSTTLYAALGELGGGEKSILTIEDPVESRLPGVKQIQVAPKFGVTFQTGLRSILRADPDVIMVGEIRDRETAQIAVEAALTGHLVLSTLHTRDAPSALGRLIDMGIESFLVSAAIDCVVAQRLVRRLCPHCKRPMRLPDPLREQYDLVGIDVFGPEGCARCAQTGYHGRVGVYEVMAMSDELRELVLARAPLTEVTALAERQGMRRLREDGLEKARSGETSIAEVERVSASLL